MSEPAVSAIAEIPPFQLTVSKTNITKKAIEELQKRYEILPTAEEKGGLAKLKLAKKEVEPLLQKFDQDGKSSNKKGKNTQVVSKKNKK